MAVLPLASRACRVGRAVRVGFTLKGALATSHRTGASLEWLGVETTSFFAIFTRTPFSQAFLFLIFTQHEMADSRLSVGRRVGCAGFP